MKVPAVISNLEKPEPYVDFIRGYKSISQKAEKNATRDGNEYKFNKLMESAFHWGLALKQKDGDPGEYHISPRDRGLAVAYVMRNLVDEAKSPRTNPNHLLVDNSQFIHAIDVLGRTGNLYSSHRVGTLLNTIVENYKGSPDERNFKQKLAEKLKEFEPKKDVSPSV